MNRLFLYLVALSFLTAVCSCKKDNGSPTERQEIKVAIKSNENYSYDLGGYGVNEKALITRQASHYQVSSVMITRQASNSVNVTYKYNTASNYTGTDEVELRSEKCSNGTGRNDIFVITTIKFTITY